MDSPTPAPPGPIAVAVGWDLSPRWKWFFGIAAGFGSGVLFALQIGLIYGIARRFGNDAAAAALVFLFPCVFAVVALHEGGHWLAARIGGMRTVRVSIGRLELQPRRRGVRLRVRPGPALRGVHGLVLAFPDPERERDLRRTLRWYVAGGPLANLSMVAVSAVVALSMERSLAQALWALWGLLNLGVGVLNLLPRPVGGIASDGLAWLRAWRNGNDTLPDAVLVQIVGRQLHGQAIADLPPELMQRLHDEPAPRPLVLQWLRVYEALHAHRWAQAIALGEQARQSLAEHEAPMRDALRDQGVLVDAELAFAHAVLGRDAGTNDALAALDALDFGEPAFWYVPHLAPRVQALAAALRGDAVAARRLLRVSQAFAESSVDRSLYAYEASLRAQVETLL